MFGIILFISGTLSAEHYVTASNSLSGKVVDKITGELLPGVSIYFPDLKAGTVTNQNGLYSIAHLPSSRVLVQVTFVGYKMLAEVVDLSTTAVRDFELEVSVVELNEVVVTGLSKAALKNRTPAPMAGISPVQLLQNVSTNIIDALAKLPGVSQVTTGSGISKPVIRGLGYNRVVTVHDGIRQEGQQWGDEHGIEVDEYSVNRVEVLKGPASLAFGSDAMAGVINLISAPTLPEGNIEGSILANYQTNNGLLGYSGNFKGNRKGFIWDIRYSHKIAHSYQNKYDGYVLNSGFREHSLGGTLGLNKAWGYAHLHVSAYNLTPGIVEGERDSATGQFTRPVAIDEWTTDEIIAGNSDFKSYHPLVPYQEIHHYKAVLNSSVIMGDANLKTTLGFQQNQRKEFAEILTPDNFGLYFLLNTFNYDIRCTLPEKRNLNISFGVNGMQQSSKNKGTEFLIPAYSLFDAGFFVVVRKNVDRLDISGGLRYDTRFEKGEDLFLSQSGVKLEGNEPGAIHQFDAFSETFTGWSGSLGATYQFSEKVFTKVNVSRGFRAPNIAEISANGVHEGTISFLIGSPKLKAENSLQFDYALGLNSTHISAEADVFTSVISHYIFLSKLENAQGGDSLTDGFATFKYASGNASVSGVEVSLDIHPHPLDWLHIENTFSYVVSKQQNMSDSAQYMPFTPAPKLTSEVKATKKKIGKTLANGYLRVGLSHYFRQDKFYAAFNTETSTPGYQLMSAGAGTEIVRKNKVLLSLHVSVENLTDVAYQSHLSRLKYAAVNNLTGRTGVFNMGRNFSIKLLIPIVFNKG